MKQLINDQFSHCKVRNKGLLQLTDKEKKGFWEEGEQIANGKWLKKTQSFKENVETSSKLNNKGIVNLENKN